MGERLLQIVTEIRDALWGPFLLVALLGTGAYLMILLRGLPLRKLFWAVRLSLGERSRRTRGEGEVTAFSSLATELAATIGTGNVIGVVSAMALGGPGALAWMMASGILGLSTKLVESTMSVKYRRKRAGRPALGGPMITLSKAFPIPLAGRLLAGSYAFLAILCSFGMGNVVQSNAIATALHSSFGWKELWTGTVISVFTFLAVLGGMKSVSKISSLLVPAMGALYLAGCMGIICTHPQNLPLGLHAIFLGAFSPRAACGGVFGTVTTHWLQGMRYGVSRGIFSNEAGLGAGGISAAASSEQNPVRQGWISMSAVFFDTILICMVSGLAYACSGVEAMAKNGRLFLSCGKNVSVHQFSDLMLAAFEQTYGAFGGALLGVCITLFAFATILGWEVQGEAAYGYLFGEGRIFAYRVLYGIIAFLGAFLSLDLVWTISDLANALLAIPNLIALWVLGPGIAREILEDPEGRRGL